MYPLIFMDIDSEIPDESRSVVLTLCPSNAHSWALTDNRPP